MSEILLLSFLLAAVGLVAALVIRRIRSTRADRAALAKFLVDHNDPRPHLQVIEPSDTITSSSGRRVAIGPQRRVAIGAGALAAAIGAGAVITATSTPPDAVDSDVTLPGPTSSTGQAEHISQPMPTTTLDRRVPMTQRPHGRRPPRTASATTRTSRTSVAPSRTANPTTSAPKRTTATRTASRPTTTPTSTTTTNSPTPTEDTLNHPSQHRGHERKERSGDGERKGLISSLAGLIGQIVH